MELVSICWKVGPAISQRTLWNGFWNKKISDNKCTFLPVYVYILCLEFLTILCLGFLIHSLFRISCTFSAKDFSYILCLGFLIHSLLRISLYRVKRGLTRECVEQVWIFQTMAGKEDLHCLTKLESLWQVMGRGQCNVCIGEYLTLPWLKAAVVLSHPFLSQVESLNFPNLKVQTFPIWKFKLWQMHQGISLLTLPCHSTFSCWRGALGSIALQINISSFPLQISCCKTTNPTFNLPSPVSD